MLIDFAMRENGPNKGDKQGLPKVGAKPFQKPSKTISKVVLLHPNTIDIKSESEKKRISGVVACAIQFYILAYFLRVVAVSGVDWGGRCLSPLLHL